MTAPRTVTRMDDLDDIELHGPMLSAWLPAPPVAGRAYIPRSSGGSFTGVTFQRIWRLYQTVNTVRLVFANLAITSSGETATGDFTLKCSVMWRYGQSDQTIVPVTFSNASSITIPAYGVVVSDPIPVQFTQEAGDYFSVLSYVTQSGSNLPYWLGDQQDINGYHEGYLSGDYTATGNSFSGATQDGSGFGPVAVCGWPRGSHNKSVLILGDSIAATTNWQISEGARSFLTHALDEAQIPAVGLARGGETVATAFAFSAIKRRLMLGKGCRYAVSNYGVNDINTTDSLATIKANLIGMWDAFARYGMKVFHTTITPKTNSTDGWQTIANQSPWFASDREAIRLALNEWLRAPIEAGAGLSALFDAAGALSGVFDTAGAVEVNADGTALEIDPDTGEITNGDGGFWIVDQTTYVTAAATSITATRVNDTTKTWTTSQWRGYTVAITADAGTPAAVGQAQLISANTATQLVFDTAWSTTPSNTATYRIFKGYAFDGLHPTSFGHLLMADEVDTSVFR